MKSLYEHLQNTGVILEAFQSNIIRDEVWAGLRGASNGSWAMHALQWDKISDDDLERFDDIETAQKAARKRNERNMFIWMYKYSNGRDAAFVGLTDGTDFWAAQRALGTRSKLPRLPEIALNSNYAYRIINPERFNTRDLKVARIKARENALAFKTNEQVARENQKRYEKLLNALKMGNKQDIQGWLDRAMIEYQATAATTLAKFREVALNPAKSDEITAARKLWQDLTSAMGDIMANINSWLAKSQDYQKQPGGYFAEYDARQARESYNKIKSLCDHIQEIFDSINTAGE